MPVLLGLSMLLCLVLLSLDVCHFIFSCAISSKHFPSSKWEMCMAQMAHRGILHREYTSELAVILAHTFHLSKEFQTVPPSWKNILMQPIHKKGDHSNCSHHQPSAPASVVSRIFEDLYNSHFPLLLESHSLLSVHQLESHSFLSICDLSLVTQVWSSSLMT